MKNVFSAALAKFKNQYVPTVDNKLRMTMDGNIAAPHGHDGEYTYFNGEELLSIPEDLTIAVPIYTISKPISQIQVGDVIKTGDSKKWTFHKVVEITEDGKISTLTFGGSTRKITPIKDFFLGTKNALVAVNMFGNMTSAPANNMGMNPMMLMMLAKDGDSDMSKLLPLMMMQGGQQMNPMMMMLLADDGDNDALTTMLMMQMMQNGGMTSMFQA